MKRRDREWLRRFLFLGVRADGLVPLRDIERQEDTVLRALEMLDQQPGVVLADEVGMGKTYEALGVVAARLHENPDARILILTPGPDLNTKWSKELRAFSEGSQPMYGGLKGRFVAVDTLGAMIEQLSSQRVVIAPVNIFAGSRWQEQQAYLLSLWADARELAGNQLAAILRRYREGLTRVATDSVRFLDTFAWDRVRPHVKQALKAHARCGSGSLDGILKEQGYEGFGSRQRVDRALADLRFCLIASMLPDLDLLVIDEAHKLKNSASVRASAVRTIFERRFEKAVFLTATPFQLTVDELRQVFALFALARSAPDDLDDRARGLLADVQTYTILYAELERVWARADGAVAADFETWFARDPDLTTDPEDPTLRPLVKAARQLLSHKRERIEPGFRAWMIRSLREDKRIYRRVHRHRLRARGGAGVPFMLYERFIAELFRSKGRTHKAAVQINMVSSYSAAREGALLSDEVRAELGPEAEAYRGLLQQEVGDLRDARGGHPKVDFVVRDAIEAAMGGEKTLIFCARVYSVRELKREIDVLWDEQLLARWQAVYPGATHEEIFEHTVGRQTIDGRHSRLRDRFKSPLDALYLSLRERYVATLLDATDFALDRLPEVTRRANEILRQQQVGKTQAERIDWSLVKRCVEQAAALELRAAGEEVETGDIHALSHLCDPRFVSLGYDLEADDAETFSTGDAVPTWTIDEESARLALRPTHLWIYLKSLFTDLNPKLRVRMVERIASYLVSREITFLPAMLAYARSEGIDVESVESRALLPVIDRFWTSPAGRSWIDLIRRFLTYAGRLDEGRRREVLDDVVGVPKLVRHTVDGESRERLREAFNTPLYPMILVANEVMQEGLDLHHHCRRVVHHDLAWNPAQLEQRVGRVDRLGSLTQRMRVRQPATTLDVNLPLVANTIDERIERTVRLRERWLEFLLGASPRIDEYSLGDDPPQPLPPAFAEALRVDLGPPRARSQ